MIEVPITQAGGERVVRLIRPDAFTHVPADRRRPRAVQTLKPPDRPVPLADVSDADIRSATVTVAGVLAAATLLAIAWLLS